MKQTMTIMAYISSLLKFPHNKSLTHFDLKLLSKETDIIRKKKSTLQIGNYSKNLYTTGKLITYPEK